MPTNKDIKELLEARKKRRAIPQGDPADDVARPEADVTAGVSEQRTDTPQGDVEVPRPVIEEPPELVADPPTTTPPVPLSAGLAVDDPRTQPVPPDDLYVPKTLRVKSHRERQLKAEAYHRDILMQDIIETALDEYFKKRYDRQGRGQRQQ